MAHHPKKTKPRNHENKDNSRAHMKRINANNELLKKLKSELK